MRRPLFVWPLLAVLLAQTGCAMGGVGVSPPATQTSESPGTAGGASATDVPPPPVTRGWAAGTGGCIKDFVAGQVFDPTVIVMLPVVFPVCLAIAALGIQAPRPPTLAAADAPVREPGDSRAAWVEARAVTELTVTER